MKKIILVLVIVVFCTMLFFLTPVRTSVSTWFQTIQQSVQHTPSSPPPTETNPNANKMISIGNLKQAQNILPVISKIAPVTLQQDIGASLDVCNIGPDCSGDMGSTHWMKDATINVSDMKRGFRWQVSKNDTPTGLLEISLTPLGDKWPSDALYSQNVTLGSFVFDFSSLPQLQQNTQPPASPKQNNGNSLSILKTPLIQKMRVSPALASVLLPKTYYIRVVPTKDGKIAGKPTNEVVVQTVAPPDNFKLYTVPNIYTVKIKDFQPIKNPDPGVCSHAMIMDTDYVLNGTVMKKAGERICPTLWKGIGEKHWYESLWDALKSGVSWVSETYAKLKSSIVNVVGGAICMGNATCRSGLAAGLDIGLVAMGIPPDLPNFDQLMDQGFDYLASEISSQAGCPDTVCKDLIKKGLKEALDQTKNTDPGCMDAGAAHDMGIEPLCLPKGVTAHWDPAAMYRDAKVVLTVSRNNDDVPQNFNVPYTLSLTSWAHNTKSVGELITDIEPYGKSLKIADPLEGEVFQNVTMTVPLLEKGQTIDIPINLVASEYWVPGHKDLMGGWSTVVYKDGWPQYQYDDWWLLYFGGDLSLSTTITGMGGIQTTVSSDSKTIHLPTTLNP